MRGRADAIGQKARRTQIHTRDRVRDAVRPRVTVQGRLGLQTEQHRHAGGLRRLEDLRGRFVGLHEGHTIKIDDRVAVHGQDDAQVPCIELFHIFRLHGNPDAVEAQGLDGFIIL